jgi:glycosyltransferase involved in cell wall biosynthesis
VPHNAASLPSSVVSVAMITYNHARFIVQSVRSVLAQRAPFPFELVIGDDCSTDGTTELLRALAADHPATIRLLPREQNLGFARNSLDVVAHCRGKYLAFLEGDDYWTQDDSLARQVAYLENHPECSLCFGRADYLIEATGEVLRGAVGPTRRQATYDLDDLLARGNFIPTNSVLLRRTQLDEAALAQHTLALPVGDFVKHLLLAREGQLGYIDEVFYVYRGHAGGVFSGQPKARQAMAGLAVYERMGPEYGWTERDSFRLGLARGHLELFRALVQADGIRPRLRAAARALWQAPMGAKPEVLHALLREVGGRLWNRRGRGRARSGE